MTDTGPERYFILIYTIPSRELEIHPFEQDFDAAAEAYTDLELQHRDDRAIEVVLVGADSIETIHKTHSHYFADHAEDLFQQFLQDAAAHSGGRIRPRSSNRQRRRKVSS
jgi:hypothetical protein